MTDRKRVFSGIQPTGELHFGNLVGALDNWVKMQKDYETYYCVVDLHAMTVPYDPAELAQARLDTAKLVMAAGVDPTKITLLLPEPGAPTRRAHLDPGHHHAASASSSG